VLFESVSESFKVGPLGRLARHHDEVNTAEPSLPQAEAFPGESLDAVPVGGAAYAFFSDGKAQTRIPPPIRPSQHSQTGVRRLLRMVEDILEIGGFA